MPRPSTRRRYLVGPWFDGTAFSLVDAAIGPVFRYIGVFDRIGAFGILDGKAMVAAWRQRLSLRPSVADAVAPDYPERLLRFLDTRRSHISQLVAERPQRVPA